MFRDIHAFEIKTHLRILDVINEEIARLDEAIGKQLALVPRTMPACTACGAAGGGHAPGCDGEGTPLLGLVNARVLQSGQSARPGRTGKGDPYLRGALGQCVMAIAHTDTRLGAMYRRIARKRGKQKAMSRSPASCARSPGSSSATPAPGSKNWDRTITPPRSPERQTRDKIRELSRLNPGKKVLLVPADDADLHAAAVT